MKREIKFRAKRVDNGEWVYGCLIQRIDCTEIHDGVFTWAIKPETVGQFTGLLDKNGVEIYEGDILYYRYDDEMEADGYGEVYNEVVFKDGAFGIMGEITNEFLPFSCDPIIAEVVAGNIHDKHKQKQALIDVMRGDEEIGLYDDNTKNH